MLKVEVSKVKVRKYLLATGTSGGTLAGVERAEAKLVCPQEGNAGTSLVAQWIRLRTPNAGSPGSIPGQGTRSHMHATTKSLHATTKELASHN